MKPIEIIDSLRKTDPYIKTIFLQGSCYKFHLFLKDLFPESVPYIDKNKQHVITRIGGYFYDIRGYVRGLHKYEKMGWQDLADVEKWSFHEHNRLKITECPACDEPIGI